jgi:hypothetical protein
MLTGVFLSDRFLSDCGIVLGLQAAATKHIIRNEIDFFILLFIYLTKIDLSDQWIFKLYCPFDFEKLF